MIKQIQIQNFRSVRNLELELDNLNIVFGPNGCGKSNIYKAIQLLSAAANGNFSQFLSEEGGLENVMWSGQAALTSRAKKRMLLSCETTDYEYELQVGFPEPLVSMFNLDPKFKEEHIWLSGHRRRPSACVLQRKYSAAFLTNVNGEKSTYSKTIYENESVFGQLSDPHLYPEVSQVRESMRNWRFYHEFNISRHSALRIPQVGYRSPVLASDGSNLAAAFQTLVEIGGVKEMEEILDSAFPDCRFFVENERSRFTLLMQKRGLIRPLSTAELSDGTLRFLCLTVALLSPRPPAFIALNEPENSLHPQMLPALAKLIIEASRYTQIWLTSHSPVLAELIGKEIAFRFYELENNDGETKIREQNF
ncbi:chromosome segregation protein SMC [Enterobacteriaceae bacterium 89]|nr:chromosome segregation protein SMC [Enterobacteriaceae bacterium 89]